MIPIEIFQKKVSLIKMKQTNKTVRKLPKEIIMSGVAQSLMYNSLAGIVGVLFLIFGFVRANSMLKIVGILAIVFYLVTSLTNTRYKLSKIANQLSEREFNKTVAEALRSQKESATTYYEKFTKLAESKISSVKKSSKKETK